MLKLYEKYHLSKEYTSIGLFRELRQKFNPQRAVYPGCYVHITPSLIFEDVVYIDSFRDTNKFYESAEVMNFLEENKEYEGQTNLKFYHQDYYEDIDEKLESFDLIISQYGGFCGQAIKKYLKKGGLLVCNNSHGDASMASIDSDYQLVAVYNRITDEKYSISQDRLDEYLIPKKQMEVTKEMLEKTMKGVAYTKSPSGYLFRKI